MVSRQHVDMDAVEKSIAESNLVLSAGADEPGEEGAQARMMISVGSEWTRHFGNEINRGTTPSDIQHAMAWFVANIIAEFAYSLCDEGTIQAKQVQTQTVAMIAHYVQQVIAGLAERVYDHETPVTTCGNA